MKSHFPRVVRLAADATVGYLADQELDPTSRDYGGLVSGAQQYAEPGGSGSTAGVLLSFYLCKEHPRYRDALLLKRSSLLLDHLLREQHHDGTLDLKATNFHDATMVGFVTQNLAYTYRLVSAHVSQHPELEVVLQKLETFLRRGAEGMRTGGFHTPNHRWVLASALSLVYRIFDDSRYREAAEAYLAEGIDCTEEGEYTERSVGVYNVVNNRSLMIMAEELDRPELLDHVARNLTMVLSYVEPDGSLFTLNSRRQDQGQRPFPTPYYENYLLMAHATSDARFASVAEAILGQVEAGKSSARSIYGTLTHYLLRPRLRDAEAATPPEERVGGFDDGGFLSSYRFFSHGSALLRIREGLVSTSVLGRNPTFAKFQVGELALSLRIAGTFYGDRGRFEPEGIEVEGEEYVLRYHDRWGYVRPFDPPPSTSVWDDMPHHERRRVHVQDYVVTVRVAPERSSLGVKVSFEGLAGVLTRVEMILSPGGYLDTGDLRIPGAADAWGVLRANEAVYCLGPDRIRIIGSSAAHSFARDMRGGQDPVPGAFTLYCTGYTPTEHNLCFEADGRATV